MLQSSYVTTIVEEWVDYWDIMHLYTILQNDRNCSADLQFFIQTIIRLNFNFKNKVFTNLLLKMAVDMIF